ncbi:hypothetical protein Cme02nite_42950 [Catellatospora methionotrophica]|uniref:Uncharacterized protein n=1 Tax=Catellatospora methionotrophica TaxID=121620 RepID=A0A8J3PH27_9ACTN|nr:hypothetical protein Cme02nite_42950 [Catellatospora methionotrophica]
MLGDLGVSDRVEALAEDFEDGHPGVPGEDPQHEDADRPDRDVRQQCGEGESQRVAETGTQAAGCFGGGGSGVDWLLARYDGCRAVGEIGEACSSD